MKRPRLQLALDNLSLEDALHSLANGVAEEADIIECGTLLLCAEGKRGAKLLRTLYPQKPFVVDFKIADSGTLISGMLLEAEPDYITVICSAHIGTIQAVQKEIRLRGLNTQIQIELYGKWDFDDVALWRENGVRQVILHHSRDAKGGWTPEEINLARRLCEAGMEVTVTGGIGYDDLALFQGLPIFCVICGRSIREADDPAAEIRKMKARLAELWRH